MKEGRKEGRKTIAINSSQGIFAGIVGCKAKIAWGRKEGRREGGREA